MAGPTVLSEGDYFVNDQDLYTEITRVGGLVDSVIIYTESDKLQKVRETNYTRTSGLISSVELKNYDANGNLVETITDTYTRTGNLITSIVSVLT